jgi:hypothetical protein
MLGSLPDTFFTYIISNKTFFQGKIKQCDAFSDNIYIFVQSQLLHLLQFEITIVPEIKQCHAVTYSFCTLSTVFTFTY